VCVCVYMYIYKVATAFATRQYNLLVIDLRKTKMAMVSDRLVSLYVYT